MKSRLIRQVKALSNAICVFILVVSEIKENIPLTMSLTSPVPVKFPQ